MAVAPMTFTPETFEQANPYLTGMEHGQKYMQKQVMFPQEMQKAMLANVYQSLQNKWYGPQAQAKIGLEGAQAGLAGAQAGLAGSEAAKNRFMVNNPAYINFPAWYYTGRMGGGGGGSGMPTSGGMQTGAGGGSGMPGADGSMTGGSGDNSQQPSSNGQQYGPYGVPIPQLGATARDPMLAKTVGIAPIDQAKINNYGKQLAEQPDIYTKRIGEAAQRANGLVNAVQGIDAFNAAMDKSFFRGQNLGSVPSSKSFETTALGIGPLGHDFTPEQQADYQATTVLPGKIALIKQAMGTGRFSNLDMQQAQKMSADRSQNDEVRAFNQNWMHAVKDRSMEEVAFNQKLGNPQSGAMGSLADLIWQTYQNDNPLISNDGRTVMRTNLGNWPLYTSPAAVQSFRDNGTYTPPKAGKDSVLMSFPDGNFYPVPKTKIKDATIKYHARIFK